MVIPDYSGYNESLRQNGHWAALIPFHRLTSTAVPLEETRDLSEQLFHNIVSERIRRDYVGENAQEEGFDETESRDETDSSVSDFFSRLCSPVEYSKPDWRKIGADLGRMADEFAQSKERQKVKDKAESVSYDGFTKKENFYDLLRGLFSDKPARNTRERIVVLFIFCSDLLIRVLKDKVIAQAKRLFSWSASFFRETVADWVQKQGGWGALVNNHFPRFAVCTCAIVITIAAMMYIKKNWK